MTTCADAPIKARRSNKLHTAKAVEAVEQYLDGSSKRHWASGNTEVVVDERFNLTVMLYDRPILELKAKSASEIGDIIVHGGGFYDNDGNPSRTTQERLNGLFDCLESKGVIPDGIRIYREYDSGVCVIGAPGSKFIFNTNFCQSMSVKILEKGSDSVFDSMES